MKKSNKALLAALVALAVVDNANALDVTTEVTGCLAEYYAPPDNLWWQKDQPHDNSGLKTKCGKLAAVFMTSQRTDVSLSIYTLGKYHQEGWAVPDAGPNMGGAPDLYKTKGRMTGVALTGIFHTAPSDGLGAYLELGLTYYKETFNLDRSDGFNFQYSAYGPGYTVGLGVQYGKHWKVGAEFYNGDVGAKMNGHGFPSGKGQVIVPLSVKYRF